MGTRSWIQDTRRELHGHVRRLVGYDERTAGPLQRDELPGGHTVVIIELGPPLRVAGAETFAGAPATGGFVAGLSEHPTATAHDGWQQGIQLDLTPSSARRVFGVSARELSHRVVPFRELCGDPFLAEQLQELPDWNARLSRVEDWLGHRLERGRRPDRRVVWAERRLVESEGNLPLRQLREELGMSERRFIELFVADVGVTPKRFARLLRFERLKRALRATPPSSFAAIAQQLGYHDQSHLIRDARAFAGRTPTALRQLLRG